MVCQILGQPRVPGLLDASDRCKLGILIGSRRNDRDDAQVGCRKMRVGTEMIAQDHGSRGLQRRQLLFGPGRADARSFQRGVQFADKTGFAISAAQECDDQISN